MMNSVLNWLNDASKNYPDKVAICDETGSITYKKYREKSIALAYRIISIKNKLGIDNKTPVVVYLEKGLKVLVSFMGAAYSGGFYSPIDVDMPDARAKKILEILEPKVVITTEELKDRFKSLGFDGEYIIYDEVNYGAIKEGAGADLGDLGYLGNDDNTAPEIPEIEDVISGVAGSIIDTDLLYVLFTSGSTGVPKGVSICHRSVIDYIDWVTDEFNVESEDVFGNQSPFYFDNSVLDIYSCLKTGARLDIIPKKLFAQPVPLLNYIKDHEINSLFWVPSAMIVVSKLRALKNVDLSGTLKRVLFAGEVMPNKQLNYWRKHLPNVLYANLYGPTEITVDCAFYKVDREFLDDEPLPMGGPTRNTDILVLNSEDKLVDIDEVGELCVRGTSLALGYYNNPEKTGEVFVQNPLNTKVPELIYRTGDLVKYNERRELVYVSRKDFQIKHLGHRIELGEIEVAASSLNEVDLCCCLYDDSRREIVLFVDSDLDKEYVRESLKDMLPDYMLPGKVRYLEDMPINANGKIDRVKLKELLQSD